MTLYPDIAAARAEGYRACRRCLPDDVMRERDAVRVALAHVERACGEGDGIPALAQLARKVGYSPDHLRRVFTRAVGISPAEYGRALRLERVRGAMHERDSVTDAIYNAGYEAPSRFYDEAKGRLGMSASAWVKGGQGVTIRWGIAETALGRMLVAATDKGVCRLSFNEGEAELKARFPNAELVAGDAAFAATMARVIAAVEMPGSDPDIPLDVRGTAFQERIWQELRRIPPGETRSYAEIAAAAGKPKAVRAAGSANGANNVAVLIPCHRVVRSDGGLGGYAYGEAIKAELLRREKNC